MEETIKKVNEEIGEVLKKYNCTLKISQGIVIEKLPEVATNETAGTEAIEVAEETVTATE